MNVSIDTSICIRLHRRFGCRFGNVCHAVPWNTIKHPLSCRPKVYWFTSRFECASTALSTKLYCGNRYYIANSKNIYRTIYIERTDACKLRIYMETNLASDISVESISQ